MTEFETVELENDWVTVTRVSVAGPGPGSAPSSKRRKRVIVHLRDSHVERHENGKHETLRRTYGDVVWRDASQHDIAVKHIGEHEVLIIELKGDGNG